MTPLLPFPAASAALLATWLLLNQSLSPGQIVLGGAASVACGWALMALKPPKARVRRLGALLRLSSLVLADIVRSNLAVGRIILGFGRRGRKSGFVEIPLHLRDPYGLAALACIITSTPGTLWVSFDAATGTLMIHVLDLIDEREWVDTIKHRYERPLLEIFE